jgi:ribulose-bisphosphate carboxylase large chain
MAERTYTLVGTTDVLFISGGGILGHPGGPAAGVAAIQQAWDAAVAGIPVADYAATHAELRAALEKFGKKKAE